MYNRAQGILVGNAVRLIKDLHFGGIVIIKGADGYLSPGDDVPDGNIVKVPFRQELHGRVEESVLGLLRLKLPPAFIFNIHVPYLDMDQILYQGLYRKRAVAASAPGVPCPPVIWRGGAAIAEQTFGGY